MGKGMFTKKKFFNVAVLAVLVPSASPLAAAAEQSPKVQAEIKRCLKNWMPPGTSDREQKWYDPDMRCEANKAVPKLDEARCERTVKRLAELSAELNDSVELACNTYIPELVADGCQQTSKDPHCIAKMNELLARASENSANFDRKLSKFISRLARLREISLEGAKKVYEATLYSERRKEAIEEANRYFQNVTGDPSAEDFVKRNRNQQSGPLKQLISEFENHRSSDISGADLGSASGQSAIVKRAAGLDKAWRSLEQKVPSPLAYEQLVNTLDSEEAHLKMLHYKNDIARMKKDITQMRATNDKTLQELKNMGSLESSSPSANSAAPVAAAALPGFSGANESARNAALTGPTEARATEEASPLTLSFTPVRASGGNMASAAARAEIDMKGANKASPAAAAENGSGSSRYRGSLRDALRNKLAQDLKAGNSEAATFDKPEKTATMEKGPQGYGRPAGRDLASAGGVTNDFEMEGSLNDGGFSLGGAEHDEFVNGILSNFEEAMKNEQSAPENAYIGGLESSPLFERVKIYHDRCLRQGCVSSKE